MPKVKPAPDIAPEQPAYVAAQKPKPTRRKG